MSTTEDDKRIFSPEQRQAIISSILAPVLTQAPRVHEYIQEPQIKINLDELRDNLSRSLLLEEASIRLTLNDNSVTVSFCNIQGATVMENIFIAILRITEQCFADSPEKKITSKTIIDTSLHNRKIVSKVSGELCIPLEVAQNLSEQLGNDRQAKGPCLVR